MLLDGAKPGDNVAVVSAPSVFVAMKNLLVEWPESERPNVVLLEHDVRFEVFGSEFVFYDYRRPFDLPGKRKGPSPLTPPKDRSEERGLVFAVNADEVARCSPPEGKHRQSHPRPALPQRGLPNQRYV